VKINVYKAQNTKSSIKAYVENNKGTKLSYVSYASVNQKNREYSFNIPIQMKTNCNKKYSDGIYSLVVEGLDLTVDKSIRLEGLTTSLCPDDKKTGSSTLKKEEKVKGKISYDVQSYPASIQKDKIFNCTLKIINNETIRHKITAYSYLFRGSKSYSGPRGINNKSLTVPPHSSTTLFLENEIHEQIQEGKYRYKIRIYKDDQKTPKEFTYDVNVKDIEVKKPSLSIEEKTKNDETNINLTKSYYQEINISNHTKPQKKDISQITGMSTVYLSKNRLALSKVPFFMVVVLGIITIFLTFKSRF
jgi:hypothetical protein